MKDKETVEIEQGDAEKQLIALKAKLHELKMEVDVERRKGESHAEQKLKEQLFKAWREGVIKLQPEELSAVREATLSALRGKHAAYGRNHVRALFDARKGPSKWIKERPALTTEQAMQNAVEDLKGVVHGTDGH